MIRFFILNFSLIFFSSQLCAAAPYYDGSKIELEELDLAYLYKRNEQGKYVLVGENLNNKTAFQLYEDAGRYQLRIPFALGVYPKADIYLQIRGGQSYQSVRINDVELTGIYKPIDRLLLSKEYLAQGINYIAIDFDVTEAKAAEPFRDLVLSNLALLQQESMQFSLASLSFAVLFVMLFLIAVSLYFAFQRPPVLLFSSMFYFFSAANALPAALFWLGELDSFVYGSYLALTSALIGLAYLMLNLTFIKGRAKEKVVIITVACLCSWLMPLPNFFVFGSLTFLGVLYLLKWNAKPIHLCILLAIPLITAIDSFNLFDAGIEKIDSITAKSFLYQLDYLAMSLFSLHLLVFFFSQWRLDLSQHHSLKLQKKNLELQLINKHIQPHFLMNAMMSIQQQIEYSPAEAIKMIDLLSEEFQLLHKQVGKDLVPLDEEVAMCDSMLQFVAKKQQAKYEFDINTHDLHICIPPGILFTFIENGIKHGYRGDSNGRFMLTATMVKDQLVLSVENDGLLENQHAQGRGLGLRFVRQQLEIWQPNKWELVSKASEQGWKNQIIINGFVDRKPS